MRQALLMVRGWQAFLDVVKLLLVRCLKVSKRLLQFINNTCDGCFRAHRNNTSLNFMCAHNILRISSTKRINSLLSLARGIASSSAAPGLLENKPFKISRLSDRVWPALAIAVSTTAKYFTS